MIAYSTNENEGYLTQKGVENLRSAFAKDIFQQDLLCTYEKQTQIRDELKADSKKLVTSIVSEINSGSYDNEKVEELLLKLADRLSKTNGKKVYGYLKSDVKGIVDSIVDELSNDERIKKLYELWYEQKENTIRTYTDELPKRIPLVDNKEFKSIKNVVIKEALNIDLKGINVKDILSDEITAETFNAENSECDVLYYKPDTSKNSWWTNRYLLARKYLYGTKYQKTNPYKAFELMQAEANAGNGFAMYDLAKMYLEGLGCNENNLQANEWFKNTFSAFIEKEKIIDKKDYLQYRIGKMYSFGYGVQQDYAQAKTWYEKSIENKNPFAAYALGSMYQRGQGVTQNYCKAIELFTLSASDYERPNAYAAYELGKMYEQGLGTDINLRVSTQWYEKAYKGLVDIESQMSDDKLCYRLGQMNLKGVGTDIDLKKAKEYLEKSASLKNINAVYSLAILYLNENFEECNPEIAKEYFKLAADNAHEYAQYRLGRMYLYGKGVEQDMYKAVYYLTLSANQGNVYAQFLLNNYGKGRGNYAFSGALNLLYHLAKTLQTKMEDENKIQNIKTDKKLMRKIEEKKQAQGLH